jgi:hypothetical protein
MSLSTIEQLLSELSVEVTDLKSAIAEKDATIASLEKLVAELRMDLREASSSKPKKRNPMLQLCGSSSSDETARPRRKRAKQPPPPGRIIVDDLSPRMEQRPPSPPPSSTSQLSLRTKKWDWSDEYDSDKPMAEAPRPERPPIARAGVKWDVCWQK